MEAISKATFNKWAQCHKWILITDAPTPMGRQYTYLTPAGTLTIAVFDLKGNLLGIGQPVPVAQSPLDITKPR